VQRIEAARREQIGETVTVEGIVTVEVGRILGDRTTVIQDASAGVAVRLPEGVANPVRGDRVRVTGELAAPYGNLEIRPASDGFRVSGRGPQPAPAEVTTGQVSEATEAV